MAAQCGLNEFYMPDATMNNEQCLLNGNERLAAFSFLSIGSTKIAYTIYQN